MNASLELEVVRPPVAVDPLSVAAMPSFEAALVECASKAGSQDKTVALDTNIDNALWSRIKQGEAGVRGRWLVRFMRAQGNYLPLFWLCHACGFDPRSLRRLESDLERQVRELQEQLCKERNDKAVILDFVKQARAA